MTTTKRRASRLSPEKRTFDILIAAREIFAERGYNDTVMSEIAERAGIVEGSIYRYFRNKRDLLYRMAETWFEEMIADDAALLDAISGTRNKLRFIIHRHLSSIHDQPDMSRLVFQHLRPEPDYRETQLFALNRAYTARVTAVVAAGKEIGDIRQGVSPSLVRDVIFGSIENRTWAFLRNEGDYDVDALTDQVLDMVWTGMAVPQEEMRLTDLIGRLEDLIGRQGPAKAES